jgi:hypothetical protein
MELITKEKRLVVDYQKSVHEVYSELVVILYKPHRYHHAIKEENKMPHSWGLKSPVTNTDPNTPFCPNRPINIGLLLVLGDRLQVLNGHLQILLALLAHMRKLKKAYALDFYGCLDIVTLGFTPATMTPKGGLEDRIGSLEVFARQSENGGYWWVAIPGRLWRCRHPLPAEQSWFYECVFELTRKGRFISEYGPFQKSEERLKHSAFWSYERQANKCHCA